MTKLQRIFAYGFGGTIALSFLTLLAIAILLAFGAVGCDTGKSLSPVKHGALDGGGPGLQMRTSTVFYTSCGTYTGDYPNGFVGPMPSGHCQANGTGIPSGCSVGAVLLAGKLTVVNPGVWGTIKAASLPGDPTGDD